MLTEEFWVRFRANMSDTDDWLFIDDLKFVSPMPAATPTPRPIPVGELGPTPTPTPPPKSISVNIPGLSFTLSDTSVRAGARVTFTVTNSHALDHTFTVITSSQHKSQKPFIDISVAPGTTNTDALTVPRGVSSLYFYCTVPGHEQAGMFGTVTIEN